MKISYCMAVVGLLAGTPAMAQVIIATPGNGDAARHDAVANQDRAAGHQEMNDARANAAVGNYAGAARDQAAARQDMGAAHQQARAADHDSSGGVTVQIGH